MEIDERIATMEEEFKLIKGELKQTLASVREYLMETGLPDSEYSTILAAMAGGVESQKIEMRGDFAMPKKPEPEEEEEIVEELEETPEEETKSAADSADTADTEDADESDETSDVVEDMEDAGDMEEIATEGSDGTEEFEQAETAGAEMADEIGGTLSQEEPMAEGLMMEPQTEYGRMVRTTVQETPRVNLLANLIHWVTNARKEIGMEQLPTFLEVYGLCGHLTPELKEVIMRLSDVAQPPTEETGAADVWSRLLLELHGILTGADAPAHPVRPSWNDIKTAEAASEAAAKAATEEPEEEPLQLKLVMKDSKGNDREFSLNLAPATEGKKLQTARK
ncbi:MAG: hypothetical protein PHR43_04955 [Dehalococcoidales bacterium]|nr:hypothetical protein [Dehalococcoidales bacterium]